MLPHLPVGLNEALADPFPNVDRDGVAQHREAPVLALVLVAAAADAQARSRWGDARSVQRPAALCPPLLKALREAGRKAEGCTPLLNERSLTHAFIAIRRPS